MTIEPLRLRRLVMGKPLAGQAGPACTEAIEETYPYAWLRYDVTVNNMYSSFCL